MKVVTVRCHVCGKSFLVTDANKDFPNIIKNPNYPFHCEPCALRIQSEALKQKYHEIFRYGEGA